MFIARRRAVKSCARAARVTRAEARKSRIHCSPEHCHTTKGPYTALPLAPRQGGLARYVSVKPHPPSRILTPCRMPCACPMCIPHDRILSRHQQQPSHAHTYVPTCICMNAIPADGRREHPIRQHQSRPRPSRKLPQHTTRVLGRSTPLPLRLPPGGIVSFALQLLHLTAPLLARFDSRAGARMWSSAARQSKTRRRL